MTDTTTPPPTTGRLDDIAALLSPDQRPAQNGLLSQLAKSVRDRREHDHPKWEDLYCLNLTSWAGERMGAVLRRLVDAEAEAARLRKRVAELERERGEVIELTWRPQDILLGDDDTADLMLTTNDGRPANWRLDPDQRRALHDDLAETDDDGRTLALPWARRLDADDLEGLLAEIADAASGDDDLNTLAEVEQVIARWWVIAVAEHAHTTALGPAAEDGDEPEPTAEWCTGGAAIDHGETGICNHRDEDGGEDR